MKAKLVSALRKVLADMVDQPTHGGPLTRDLLTFQQFKENGQVVELLQSDDFELVFDGNDEFWILNVGHPLWRSEDTLYEDTVNKWNEYALPEDRLTVEMLKELDQEKTQ